MSRLASTASGPAAAPRRGATVQTYGPNAAGRASKDDEPRVQAARPRRGSGMTNNSHTRADASSAASTAAAASDATATAAAAPAEFPALDRFLALKGQNLRERRLQQLNIESAQAAALNQQQHGAAGLRVDTAYAPVPAAAPAYAYPPFAFAHPLPHPAYPPQPAYVHPPPERFLRPTAAPPAAAQPELDPEPLSPASLQEVLLIPEVQEHLRELKRQWRKEFEHEFRFHQPPAKSHSKQSVDASTAADPDEPLVEGEHKSGARVRFDDSTEETRRQLDAAAATHAAELQHLRDQLLAEQQAHSATMTRLTQLTSARMEEQQTRDAEQQKNTAATEQLRQRLHECEALAVSAQRQLEEEQQRHLAQLSSVQGSDSLVHSLTAKYESLLEKYTNEKLAASEVAATQRVEHEQLERTERQLREAQHQLQTTRTQLSALEERMQQMERAHRAEVQKWTEKEQQLLFSRQDTLTKLEADNARTRTQLQAEARKHEVHAQELQEQVISLRAQLQEQSRHADERLQQEERQKQEQLRFTEQMHANLELLSRESQSKAQEAAAAEGELRSVLHALEQLKAKYVTKVSGLQEALEARVAEVDDCKVLLRTMMAEEKQSRAQKNEAKQQLQHMEQQLRDSQATIARMREESVALQSRPVSDASATRIHTLEHELRISHEIQSRLEAEKEKLAVRLEDLEEQARSTARRHAEERAQQQEQLAATPRVVEPDPQLLQQFHAVSDKLAIKEKILESLEEQLASEGRVAATLGAEVRTLKKRQSELERSVAELDEARRSAQRELQELQLESQEWARVETDNEELRKELDVQHAEIDKLTKQLAKKQDSLTYIEGEILGMKSMFERKESETRAQFDAQLASANAETTRARDECAQLRAQLESRTHAWQDAQNNVYQCEQEMRVLIAEMEKEKRQRQQLKMQLQALLPAL